jgi:hypothetical protein
MHSQDRFEATDSGQLQPIITDSNRLSHNLDFLLHYRYNTASMVKRLIVLAVVSCMLLVVGLQTVFAESEQVCTQVTQYGGAVGVVCGVKHEPVEAGLADINPVILSSIFLTLSGLSAYKYRKIAKENISL